MIKYELLPEQLIHEGTIAESQFFSPGQLSHQELLTTHTSVYLQKLFDLPLPRKEERAIGFPVREDLIHRGRHIASGTCACALNALQEGVSMNIAGGTHHAYADHGEGFCVFNDVALAINILKQNGIEKKVLVVDLDVHQGNGTASIFSNREDVFTYSIHGARNYPLRKELSDMDIPLPDNADDEIYLKALKSTLPIVFDEFHPELIFYLSGVDILEQDKLGRMAVSIEGCKSRDNFVFDLCYRNKVPVVAVMSGGYAPRISDIVEAHANTFRVVQEMYF